MQNFWELISSYSSMLVALNLAFAFVLLIALLIVLYRLATINRKYKKLVRGMENRNLEEVLHAHMDKVDGVVAEVEKVSDAYKMLKKMADHSVQKVGVVRFNAFNDTGSDLSFAVALLDSFGDGVLISSIFGREDQRTYAKPVNKGNSSYQLSVEEEKAIKIALSQKD